MKTLFRLPVAAVLLASVALLASGCGDDPASSPPDAPVQPPPSSSPPPPPPASAALWPQRLEPPRIPSARADDYAKIATASPGAGIDELVVVGASVRTQRLPRSRFAPLHAFLGAPAMLFPPGDGPPLTFGLRTVYFVLEGRVRRLGLAATDPPAPAVVSALATACDLKSIVPLDAAGDDAWLEVYERGSAPDCATAWQQAAARAGEPPTVWVRGTMAADVPARALPAGVRLQALSDRWRWVDAFAVAQPGVPGLAVWDRDLQPLGQVVGSAAVNAAEAQPMAVDPGDPWSWWRIGRTLHRLDWADRIPRLSPPLHTFDEPDPRRFIVRLSVGEQVVFGDQHRLLLQRGTAPAVVLQVLAADESAWLMDAAPAGIVVTTLDSSARKRLFLIAGGIAQPLAEDAPDRFRFVLGGHGDALVFIRSVPTQNERELLAWTAVGGWRTLARGLGNVIAVFDRDAPPARRTLDSLFECQRNAALGGIIVSACDGALARIDLDTGVRLAFSSITFPARGVFGGFQAPRAFRREGLILLEGLSQRIDAMGVSASVVDVYALSPEITNSLRRITSYGDD
jgi:hypothetical protein